MNRRRLLLRQLGPLVLLGVGGAYALASWNWCGRWEVGPPALVTAALAQGPLQAGAARADISPPYPVVVAGYPPPRPAVTRAQLAPQARALVLQMGPSRVAILSLDLLLVPDGVAQELQEKARALGFTGAIVAATHAHSSFGGFDVRFVSQLAGTGRFREGAEAAVVAAGTEALTRANEAWAPATLEVGAASVEPLVRARSGAGVDPELRRVVVRGEEAVIAELWIVAAHPTLVAREPDALSPDYPGHVDPDEGPVTIVLQGAVGNASAQVPQGEGDAVQRYARALTEAARGAEVGELEEPKFGFAQVKTALPRPDASRLVPWFARAAGDNVLCQSSPREVELTALRLGERVWVTLPFEPTRAAAQVLEERTGADRVLALANGYAGYVEPAEVVKKGEGEAKRQYYGPGLLDVLGDAAKVAVEAVRAE